MKLSQVAPLRWCQQANCWIRNLSPWRCAAVIATGVVFGVTAGQVLADIDQSPAARLQLIVSGWLMLFLLGGVMRLQQQVARRGLAGRRGCRRRASRC